MNIFLHGLESSSQGTKAGYFRTHFPDMLIPDFSGSLMERMTVLQKILAGKKHITLIGSSFGGLMATIFAAEHRLQTKKLILLAPALNFPEFDQFENITVEAPTIIYQGNMDEVTPLPIIREKAQTIFQKLDFHEVNDDHLLRKTFPDIPWVSLLRDKQG